ncbi:MAG TPA: hypothetical protein PKE43_07495 [Anaerolineales bacterium]|nr:hypothetical protein [Anaerolineales bacterium]
MNFNFGEVFTRAWQIIWKHKVLWIFGILASCARGSGGGGGNSGSRYQTSGGDAPFSGGQIEQTFNQIGQYLQDNLWIIVVGIIAILLLGLIFMVLGIVGKVGLIKGTYKADADVERLQFAELWSESLPYFWRIFGLNFLLGLAVFVIIIPFVLLSVFTGGIGALCLLPLICILIPVGFVVSIITEQAQTAMVLEDLGIMDGLKRGWEVAKANIVTMIVMVLILGIGGAIVGTVIALPLIFAVLPIVVGMGSLGESLTPLYIALACCVVYLPVLVFFNGVITAYTQSVWTLTFMRLTTPKPKEETPVFVEDNA